MRFPRPLLLLTLLVALPPWPGLAQIPSEIDADSLQARLPQTRGQERVDLLNLISTHYGEFEPERGLAIARDVLVEARGLGYERGTARALENVGQALYFLGEYDVALDTLRSACARLQDLGESRLLGYCRLKTANVYNRMRDRELALFEIGRAVERLREAGDERGLGHTYNNLGWINWRFGEYQEAIDAYEQALVIREKHGQRRYLAATLNNIGVIYYQWGIYTQALEHYLKALELREELGDLRGQSLVLNNIGKVYQDWGDTAQAIDSFEEALQLATLAGSAAVRGYSLHNVGTVHEREVDHDAALDHFLRSLVAYRDVGDTTGVVMNQAAIARVHNAQGKFELALEELDTAMATAGTVEYPEIEGQILMQMGIASEGLGQLDEAYSLIDSSLRRARSMDNRDLIKDTYLHLSHTLARMGKPDQALEYLQRHSDLKDSLFASRFGRQLADMQALHETDKLRQAAQAQGQLIASQDRQRKLTTIVLGLVGALAVMMALGYAQKRRAHQRLAVAHDALQREIDVRAETESALRESEETFRTLTDNLPVGVCRIEVYPRFQMIEANPEIVRMFDFDSREQMLASSTKEIFGTPQGRFALLRQIVKARSIEVTEIPITTRTGREFLGALTASAPIEAGGIRYLDGIIEDVTERHEFEEALRRARDAAEDASRAKSAFLANMSHEIRTPLNAILGYAQILRADKGLSSSQRHGVETVERSGDHLLTLINDILDISKIEAGYQILNPEDFDLGLLVDDLATMFEPRCREKGLGWSVEADREGAHVHGDGSKLRQVLINLLGNAVKFSEVGFVSLSVERRGEDRFGFTVIDTGSGIAEERQESVFEPFRQEDESATTGGTGLGLAIAREHVRLMGGELELESQPGAGSRFSFELVLPASQLVGVPMSDQDFTKVSRLVEGQSVKALVVDDVDENREVLEQMLVGVGVTVASARDGQEGLEAVRHASWDIVFADIRMPVMHGDELRRRIVEELGERAPKIVAVTASALDHQRQQFLDQGFDGFIDKPFRAERIYACLANLVGARFELDAGTEAPPEGEPDLAGLALPPQLLSDLREALSAHSVTRLKESLQRMGELGETERALARHLQELSKGYDIEALRRWLDEHADELGVASPPA